MKSKLLIYDQFQKLTTQQRKINIQKQVETAKQSGLKFITVENYTKYEIVNALDKDFHIKNCNHYYQISWE